MELSKNISEKWRKKLFRVYTVIILIAFALEVFIYLFDDTFKNDFTPFVYRLRFIYLPFTLNVIVWLITYFRLRSEKTSDRQKNVYICILLLFIAGNIQITHYVYGPLLVAPVIAIFMTIIFADSVLTIGITSGVLITLTIAGIEAGFELRKGDPQLVSDLLIAYSVVVVSYLTANVLTKYMREQLNMIVRNNCHLKELIEECDIDELMGIQNRKAMNKYMENIRKNEPEQGTAFLVMIDLDDFKKINDTYGHIEGDKVLVKLAMVLKEFMNVNHMQAFRYGGEEAVAIFNQTDENQVIQLVERMLENFNHNQYEGIPDLEVHFSAGIAPYKPEISDEEWIACADRAMYTAKRNGKNRVAYAENSI